MAEIQIVAYWIENAQARVRLCSSALRHVWCFLCRSWKQ